jgi:thiol-disulfide isomerase/thioredoxin
MKIFYTVTILVLILSACSSSKNTTGKVKYETIQDTETKILKGILNRAVLENDTSFAWFTNNMRYGTVDEYALNAFKQKGSEFSMIIFCGTWCHDSQNLLPKLYRLFDKSGYPENKVTLVGVDREKTTLNGLHTKWNIISIPTFIVVKNGKELGRVVEYGTTGNMERELGEIVMRL